ncbi:hypothetical protein JHK84_027621 [Glycine max]|nr:hypothetical protein JHK85_028025 [Glycine max]KAG5003365.1 hypothetical protein JHK86_027504 [Glycine max]KAG5151149.1 hypothetical protein JHK84_027621 [Glycine max]
MILKEAFNLEVPIQLPQKKPPRTGSNTTKYYRYHHGIGHNTKDYWTLKDKIEELIQFVKRPDNHQARARPGGHPEEQNKNQEARPSQHIRGVINTITGGFSYGG